jgi:uroporphyrinogen decarboxylase
MPPRKKPLSSRERVRLTLAHQPADRVPLAMVCSGINPPADAAFDALLREKKGCTLRDYLDGILDVRPVEAQYCGPRLEPGMDIWGVQRQPHSFGTGSYDEICHYPLAAAITPADLERYRWPSPDWFDYSSLDGSIRQAQQDGEHCLMIHNGNIFETSWYMRGFEQMFLDFADSPDLVHALFGRVTDFFCAHFSRLLEVADGRVDLAFTADDLGGQNGLLLSLDTWERFIKPYHQRLNRVIHEFGVKVIYHTDGAVMKAVPGLIDMGIDVLQALQFSARGMDPAALKELAGMRLCFEGGVSVQTTLPFGTVEDVRAEVDTLISVLGKDGGYILGPSHAIQAGTPAENILAMFETALDSGG